MIHCHIVIAVQSKRGTPCTEMGDERGDNFSQMSKPLKRVSIEIPPALEKLATRNDRSINREAQVAIKRHLAQVPRTMPASADTLARIEKHLADCRCELLAGRRLPKGKAK